MTTAPREPTSEELIRLVLNGTSNLDLRLLAQRLQEARAAMKEAIEYRHDYIGAYERLRLELSK